MTRRAPNPEMTVMRRRLLVSAGSALLVPPLAAQTQRAGKVHRIAYVQTGRPGGTSGQAFMQGLRDLGYVEGQNIVIEQRFVDGQPERLPGLIEEVVRANVDVIFAGSTTVARAAVKVTSTTPIVVVSADPVAAGLVSNLARPGGNVTGLSLAYGDGFGAKWLELLTQAAPKLTHVAALVTVNPESAQVTELRRTSRSLKLRLDVQRATNPAELDAALAAIASGSARGLVVTPSPFFSRHRDQIIQFAASKRLPAIYFADGYVDAGGLMSYGPSNPDAYRRAAAYVDKILKGAKPGDLAVEQPTRFDLVINLATARSLGLVVPKSVLLRAERVIE
jgi:putative tryptophan/tyrosine transport system substrate-binding protein